MFSCAALVLNLQIILDYYYYFLWKIHFIGDNLFCFPGMVYSLTQLNYAVDLTYPAFYIPQIHHSLGLSMTLYNCSISTCIYLSLYLSSLNIFIFSYFFFVMGRKNIVYSTPAIDELLKNKRLILHIFFFSKEYHELILRVK